MLEKIIKIIRQYSNEDVEINKEINLITDLGLTSFELATMSAEIEDEFGISLKMEEMLDIRTPSDIVLCIKQHLNIT